MPAKGNCVHFWICYFKSNANQSIDMIYISDLTIKLPFRGNSTVSHGGWGGGIHACAFKHTHARTHSERETETETDIHTYIHTYIQTDRQIDREKKRRTYAIIYTRALMRMQIKTTFATNTHE